MGNYDVLVVGDYCLDLIFTGLPRFPELGKEVVASGFAQTPGGTCNAAFALHRLGLHVGWAADFGNDEYSRFVLDQARAEGLDDSLFVHHSRPLRQITVAASFPEERAFIAYYDPPPTVPAAMKALATQRARLLYLPGIYAGPLLEPALLLVRAKRMKLVMGGNSNETVRLQDPAVRRAVASSDVLLPNAAEALRLTGESELESALRALAALTPLAVVKDGARGAHACQAGEILHFPALGIDPLDTTGAGDCFDAGFVAAWLDGKPLTECLQWGNIVGGLSTLGAGGTGRVVTRQDVEARMVPIGARGT